MTEKNKCKSCGTTDEHLVYIRVQNVWCYCDGCYNKSLNDSLYRQMKICCICQIAQYKDNMASCEFEWKDTYICKTCLLNDKAKVSRWNADPKIEWKNKRNIWDTVYDHRDKDKWVVHRWVIISTHPDGIHHIVEYGDLGVFKENLSEEWFSKEKYNEYQWIDDAIIDSLRDVMSTHQKTITTNDILTLKKCLIHHMPK